MTTKDILTMHRFLGIIEGITLSLPDNTQSLIYDALAVVDGILNREEEQMKGGAE